MMPDHTWFASKLLPKEIMAFRKILDALDPALLTIIEAEIDLGNKIHSISSLADETEILLVDAFHKQYEGKIDRTDSNELHDHSVSYALRSGNAFRVTAPNR